MQSILFFRLLAGLSVVILISQPAGAIFGLVGSGMAIPEPTKPDHKIDVSTAQNEIDLIDLFLENAAIGNRPFPTIRLEQFQGGQLRVPNSFQYSSLSNAEPILGPLLDLYRMFPGPHFNPKNPAFPFFYRQTQEFITSLKADAVDGMLPNLSFPVVAVESLGVFDEVEILSYPDSYPVLFGNKIALAIPLYLGSRRFGDEAPPKEFLTNFKAALMRVLDLAFLSEYVLGPKLQAIFWKASSASSPDEGQWYGIFKMPEILVEPLALSLDSFKTLESLLTNILTAENFHQINNFPDLDPKNLINSYDDLSSDEAILSLSGTNSLLIQYMTRYTGFIRFKSNGEIVVIEDSASCGLHFYPCGLEHIDMKISEIDVNAAFGRYNLLRISVLNQLFNVEGDPATLQVRFDTGREYLSWLKGANYVAWSNLGLFYKQIQAAYLWPEVTIESALEVIATMYNSKLSKNIQPELKTELSKIISFTDGAFCRTKLLEKRNNLRLIKPRDRK